jgi:hypothetical protein
MHTCSSLQGDNQRATCAAEHPLTLNIVVVVGRSPGANRQVRLGNQQASSYRLVIMVGPAMHTDPLGPARRQTKLQPAFFQEDGYKSPDRYVTLPESKLSRLTSHWLDWVPVRAV